MAVVVDRRPIWVLLLIAGLRPLTFVALGGLLLLVSVSDPPTGLTVEGFRALGIFGVCLVLWVTNLLPLAITSLLAIVLVPLMGVAKTSEVYGYFGNEAVFFILGAFILAAGLMKTGLSTRMALLLIERIGRTPRRLIAGIFLIGALMSLVMSEHAVAAMLFPIVMEAARSLKLKFETSRMGKGMFVAMAWGCIIGGIGTMLGGARVPLMVGMLKEMTGETIGFLEYSSVSIFLVVPLAIIANILLYKVFTPEIDSVEDALVSLRKRIYDMGRVKTEERFMAILLVLTVLAWIFFGHKVGLASIAIMSVVIMFIFNVVKWEDIENYVNWGVILMYGGAIALGRALEGSGAAEWVASETILSVELSTIGLISIVALVSILLTEAISNSAVIAILLPLSVGVSARYGLDPKILAFSIAIPAGLAFSMPMATPANAISYSSGFIRLKDVIVPGIIMGLISWLFFVVVASIKFG